MTFQSASGASVQALKHQAVVTGSLRDAGLTALWGGCSDKNPWMSQRNVRPKAAEFDNVKCDSILQKGGIFGVAEYLKNRHILTSENRPPAHSMVPSQYHLLSIPPSCLPAHRFEAFRRGQDALEGEQCQLAFDSPGRAGGMGCKCDEMAADN